MQRLFSRNRFRILEPSSYLKRVYAPAHSRSLLRPGHQTPMTDSPKAGQVHTLPASEIELPAVKRPRLIGKKGVKGESKRARKRREKQKDLPELCSAEDVLWRDVIAVLGQDVVDKAMEEGVEFESPFEYHQEVELEVSSLCSSGMSITFHRTPSRLGYGHVVLQLFITK